MYFWNLLVATSSACVLTEEGKVEKTKKNSLQFEIGVFFCSEREPERSKKKRGFEQGKLYWVFLNILQNSCTTESF